MISSRLFRNKISLHNTSKCGSFYFRLRWRLKQSACNSVVGSICEVGCLRAIRFLDVLFPSIHRFSPDPATLTDQSNAETGVDGRHCMALAQPRLGR